MRHVMPVMLAQGSGAIVNTASIGSERGLAGACTYNASKHAVVGLTRTAAAEAGPHGIRVNCVMPGVIDTPLLESVLGPLFDGDMPLGKKTLGQDRAARTHRPACGDRRSGRLPAVRRRQFRDRCCMVDRWRRALHDPALIRPQEQPEERGGYMASDKRYQWLLIALLSANFGVVFFDRHAFSILTPFIQPDLKLTGADRRHRGGLLRCVGRGRSVHGHALGPLRPAQDDSRGCHDRLFPAPPCCPVFATFVALMLGARMLMGIAEGGIMPITQTLIAADVSPERRGLAHGITQNFGANLLANFLGPLVIVAIALAVGWQQGLLPRCDTGIRDGLAACPVRARTDIIWTSIRSPPSQARCSCCRTATSWCAW